MLDLAALNQAIGRYGRVARVVLAGHDGSSPRENGAAMLVWADTALEGGQSGTIGGGAMEWQAVTQARRMLIDGATAPHCERQALGPHLGQCCGGAVTLVTEVFDATSMSRLAELSVHARPVTAAAATSDMPLAVKRLLADARAKGQIPQSTLMQGWLVEPLTRPKRQIWIWGAGHVGRAMTSVLAPLPDFALTWVDTSRARFPETLPDDVTCLWAEAAEQLVAHAPRDAEHLIVTYSHALDLELCHRILGHGFGWLGLIGSRTKWSRFQSRLRHLGHEQAEISKISCPIGDIALGKHPQAIALGVGVQLLKRQRKSEAEITDDNRECRGI